MFLYHVIHDQQKCLRTTGITNWPFFKEGRGTGLLPRGDNHHNGKYTYWCSKYKVWHLNKFVRGIPIISNAIFAFIIWPCCLDRIDMEELYGRYEAAMVLSAAGDALGYKNGEWEICRSGRDIQRELRNMGGIQAIHVKRKLFKSYL